MQYCTTPGTITMLVTLRRWTLRISVAFALIIITILLVRAFDSRRLPELKSWHTTELKNEFTASQRTAIFTFSDYLNSEQRVFAELEALVASNPHPEAPPILNRYSTSSSLNPLNDTPNWNRSYELRPAKPLGGIVLLHGLTDSPYSMRALSRIYFEQGFYVLVPRMPGHGTLPAALLSARVDDWAAVVELAVEHVREVIGADLPLHMGGYSNGAALAIKYTLESFERDDLETPDQLLLVSPEIAVTAFAAFAHWNRALSYLPYFRKFKWESVLPEYDPYKYNSFPKASGEQSYVLTKTIRKGLNSMAKKGTASRFPPTLAFQSLVDSTVRADAVVTDLFENINSADNHLVLFDVNRLNDLRPMLKNELTALINNIRDQSGLDFIVTLLTNETSETGAIVAITKSGDTVTHELLNTSWPPQMYSLSHVALPFPPDDPLYGNGEIIGKYDVVLGALMPRGEKHVLKVPKELLMRVRYNPFFFYMKTMIESRLER